MRHVRSLGFEAPGQPFFAGYDEGPGEPWQVPIDTLYSGFSAGTELTFMKGSNPYFHSRWDDFRLRFMPGEAGMHYPVPFVGYMEVGRVRADAAGFAEGATVAGMWGHKSGHQADPNLDLLVPLPTGIDPILGIYAGQMGPIAANGILHADAELLGPQADRFGAALDGRPVLIFGAGVVGLLTGLFAQAAGASEVVITDPSPFRRLRAECLGMTAMTEDQAVDHAKLRWHGGSARGRGADLVFQTRASDSSLNNAMAALRPQGTVIDLAFYQGGAGALRLGEEFHHNGLGLRCAQIGRVPRGMGERWDRARLSHETVRLLAARGDEIKAQMITHVVPFDDAPDFLCRLVAERPDFIQIVFDYR